MRRIGAAVLALVLSIGATGCAESKYRYITNGAEKVAIKVPRSWAVYDLPVGRQDRLSPDAPEEVELLWSKGFDADPNPDPAHLAATTDYGTLAVEHPVGVVSIYQVDGSFNQKLSLTTARTVPLGFDPLYVQDDIKDLVEIISYEPIAERNGLQGSRVLFNMRPSSDADWRTFDMTTYFDQGRFRMYTFTVGCLSPCFKESEQRLRDIAGSWSVRP